MAYQNFFKAKEQLADIEPIDFYFAREFSEQFALALPENLKELWFHLLIALSEYARNGHTCLPIETIAGHRFGFKSDNNIVTHNGFVFPSNAEILTCIEQLDLSEEKAVVLSNNCLYLRRNYRFEQELQTALIHKRNLTVEYQTDTIVDVIETLFPSSNQQIEETNSEEVDWQKLAVANSLTKGLSVIAGGPGTGKTYTVTKLLSALLMLNQREYNIGLVAPTGKAAQRLAESIANAIQGFEGQIAQEVLERIPTNALTLHRLLGVIPNQVNFRKGKDNPVDYDVVIIDEVSMVDLALMTRLFRALPEHCQVIMLGDADQLPSVALGSVLSDIAIRPHLGFSQSNIAYLAQCCQLTSNQMKQLPKGKNNMEADHLSLLYKSRRFDGEGAIGKIAMATIAGHSEESWEFMETSHQKGSELCLLSENISDWLLKYITQYYQPISVADNVESAFKLLADFRILCATRVGVEGVDAINQMVISHLQGSRYLDKIYHGLPIMINENHYGLNLYNGDIGLIWRNEHGHLMACFETVNAKGNAEIRQVIPSRLPSFEPVYAMTIHKTQGSEFQHVAMVLPQRSDNNLLSRELIYTGLTRAKHQLSICANKRTWHAGVEAKVQRYSNLQI